MNPGVSELQRTILHILEDPLGLRMYRRVRIRDLPSIELLLLLGIRFVDLHVHLTPTQQSSKCLRLT